jgi:NADH-quinone oxidoreductase subunit L
LYFKAGDLPDWLFDLLLAVSTLVTIVGWIYLYMRAHGRAVWIPWWITSVRIRLYVLFLNRLYVDGVLHRTGQTLTSAIQRLDKRAQERTL